jgi:ribosomal protein L37AE/L43A
MMTKAAISSRLPQAQPPCPSCKRSDRVVRIGPGERYFQHVWTCHGCKRVFEAPRPHSTRQQRGSVLLEFAICFPILALFVLGSLELNMLMIRRQDLDFIAGSAAACNRTAGCDVNQNIYNNTTGLNIATADLNCTVDTAVSCTLLYHPFSPYLTSDVTLQARAQ